MRLADILDICTVKLVEIAPGTSLAETAREMCVIEVAGARFIRPDGRQGFVTRGDILHLLVNSASPLGTWEGPVIDVINRGPEPVDATMQVRMVIADMREAGIEYMPVVTGQGIVIVSLSNLLLAENAFLHSEVQHLQTYIDALHEAPND